MLSNLIYKLVARLLESTVSDYDSSQGRGQRRLVAINPSHQPIPLNLTESGRCKRSNSVGPLIASRDIRWLDLVHGWSLCDIGKEWHNWLRKCTLHSAGCRPFLQDPLLVCQGPNMSWHGWFEVWSPVRFGAFFTHPRPVRHSQLNRTVAKGDTAHFANACNTTLRLEWYCERAMVILCH